jgi:tRNA A-37 threonylcarbamoyl transferase component Bud32
MADKCEFCGESLIDGDCVNPDCDLSDLAPAISDHADFSEDTFLPDLDLDDVDFDVDDEVLPEISSDREDQADRLEPTLESSSGPELTMEPELSKEPRQISEEDIAATIDSVPDLATDKSPEEGEALVPEFSKDSSGPLLSIEQAAIPIDHTGTIIFEGVQGAFHTQAELRPDQDATRLTDDENYRIIRTVLHESTESEAPQDIRTGRTKGGLTGRPEVSMTIRVQDPAETHRTLDKLPSRDLSVPSDSASLERKKARQDDYDLASKDYKIVDKVGEGGSGVVYKAKQIALKRTVALKVLKQRRMKSGSRSRTRTKELDKRKSRFLHEVHVTAKLQHPNIIPLYDLGMNSHGEVFYSMKLIDESSAAGDEVQQSWASLVRSQPTQGSEAQIEKNVSIFSRVCDAMRYAHAEQIVHRDLKPDNVMVGQFGEVLVIDWGMALDLSQGSQPFTAGGTTSYMPPEMGLHYLKQSEIHKLSHKLMVAIGEARREVYVESVLDHGSRHAAEELLQGAGVSDKVRDYCGELIRLDDEEQVLAAQVNISSDIYLLGAILYEIAVGHPPHFVPQDSCKSIE